MSCHRIYNVHRMYIHNDIFAVFILCGIVSIEFNQIQSNHRIQNDDEIWCDKNVYRRYHAYKSVKWMIFMQYIWQIDYESNKIAIKFVVLLYGSIDNFLCKTYLNDAEHRNDSAKRTTEMSTCNLCRLRWWWMMCRRFIVCVYTLGTRCCCCVVCVCFFSLPHSSWFIELVSFCMSICAQFAPKFIDRMEMKLNNKL